MNIRFFLRAFACLGSIPLLAACGSSAPSASAPASNAWVGHTYALDVPESHWSDPAQIGGQIAPFVPRFLLSVKAGSGSDLQLTLGTADASGAQDPCNPTTDFSASGADYPSVQLGPVDAQLHIKHPTANVVVDAKMYALTLTDVLPDGSSAATTGVLTTTMDMRELYPLFTQLTNPTPDLVCAALDSFMAPCQPCASDGQTYCLSVKAVRLGATDASGASLQPVLTTDASACPN